MTEHDVLHSPETIEATERGIEDWRTGRAQPLSEVLAEMTQADRGLRLMGQVSMRMRK